LNSNERLQEQPLIVVVCKHLSDEGLPLHLLPAELGVASLVPHLCSATCCGCIITLLVCADAAGTALFQQHLKTTKGHVK